MEETRDLWEAWSEDFQGAWEAETDDDELPPAPVHYGPGFPEDQRFDFLPDLDDADVVELGCGGGQASVGFAREGVDHVVGLDFSTEQLDFGRRLRDAYDVGTSFIAGDVSDLPLADDAFDLAFSTWVFQMVEDLRPAFAEAARVLRPDGVFVFRDLTPVLRNLRPRDPGDRTQLLRLATGTQGDRGHRRRHGSLPPDRGRDPPSAGRVRVRRRTTAGTRDRRPGDLSRKVEPRAGPDGARPADARSPGAACVDGGSDRRSRSRQIPLIVGMIESRVSSATDLIWPNCSSVNGTSISSVDISTESDRTP
ncbi:MAG: SAM-dependent methyltransferase [Halobacteriales archaeon]|jgi:SAM-dependent methyltransferase